ncbi:MAG: hydroxyacid dehydrogenase [Thermoplasmatales archaeon]|nr:hydroxyacid dehydrogenase [Thermoplasmatales archaeon]
MRILIADQIHPEGVSYLKSAGFDVEEKLDLSNDELMKEIPTYDALIVRSKTKVTKEIIQAGTNLLVIGRAGVGLDNVDVVSAKERNIKVLNTPDVSTTSVAELVMGFMISELRHIPQATASIKSGEWKKERFAGKELAGKTLGIVGIGRIGNAVAKRAAAFDMEVIGFDPYVNNSERIQSVNFDTLLRKSDVVSFHVPLTESTYHMLSLKEIRKMKKGVVIINASRGGIIDEEGLKQGLDEGIVGAVALDTFEFEKPFSTVLARYENFIATPHIGAQTEEAQRRAGIEIAKVLVNYLRDNKS